jgi:hypothetical protein
MMTSLSSDLEEGRSHPATLGKASQRCAELLRSIVELAHDGMLSAEEKNN